LVVGSPGGARANGRYPLATQLAAAPNDAAFLALRSTFGIVQTFDAGKSWQWVCEQAAGYADIQDPSIALTGDGSLLVGYEKLSVSHDRGCTWGPPSGFPAASVTDLAVDRDRPNRVLALSATSDGGGAVTNRIFESTDDGRTWGTIGTPITDGLVAETIETAPPNRIYVSGRYSPTQVGAIERSDDSGATWMRQSIDVAGSSIPFIAAVDPANADRVYVRTSSSTSDGVFVSSDAGNTWSRIFSASGGILGFALAPDGASIAVGGPSAGVNVASTSDHQFTKASGVSVYCLRWGNAGLYACARQTGDGFALGLSTDRGVTFAKALELLSIVPLACPADSATGSLCPAQWGLVAPVIGADAGPDASRSGTRDPSLNPVGEGAASSCNCGIARSWRSSFAAAWLAAGGALAYRRRRRRDQFGDG
jgi:photosystem II stability/assembly factor-like uncharacterized protein